MNDDPASVGASEEWVPLDEGVRMIARLSTREVLRRPGGVPPQAMVDLIESLRQGLIASRGERHETREMEIISAHDWQEYESDWSSVSHRDLRYRGRRLPVFESIEVDAIGIRRLFTPVSDKAPKSKNKGGRPPAVNWEMVKSETFRLMDENGDFTPDDRKWNAQARLEQDLESFCEEKLGVVVAMSGIQQRIPAWLDEWRIKKQSYPET
ncbi:MAG: hypothetical protein WDN46_10710 [Methylocella sp.]